MTKLKKQITTTLAFLLVLIMFAAVLVPVSSNKKDEIISKLNTANEKETELNNLVEYNQNQEILYTMKKNQLDGNDEVSDEKRYLDSSNKNIFYLLSFIGDSLSTNISEIKIEDTDVLVESEVYVEPEVTYQLDENGERALDENGDPIKLEPEVPAGFEKKKVRQVEISMYGDYIDQMLFFNILNNMSDNFKLDKMVVTPLVLENGFPSPDYTFNEVEYDFVSSKATAVNSYIDAMFFETKIIENNELIKNIELEKAEKEKALKESKELKLLEIGKTYTVDQETIIDISKYYGQKYGVPAKYILAVIASESAFDTIAMNINENESVDRGLMQINGPTAIQLAKSLNIEYVEGIEYIPAVNIAMGTKYIKSLADSLGIDILNMTDIDVHKLFTSYNRGTIGAQTYSTSNKNFTTTEFESSYSNGVVSNVAKFLEHENKPQSIYSYTDTSLAFVNSVKEMEAAFLKTDSQEVKNYQEVSNIKVTMHIIREGENTLLTSPSIFSFSTNEINYSPVSFGDKPEGITSNELSKEEMLKIEISNIKQSIKNKLLHGLDTTIDFENLMKILK